MAYLRNAKKSQNRSPRTLHAAKERAALPRRSSTTSGIDSSAHSTHHEFQVEDIQMKEPLDAASSRFETEMPEERGAIADDDGDDDYIPYPSPDSAFNLKKRFDISNKSKRKKASPHKESINRRGYKVLTNWFDVVYRRHMNLSACGRKEISNVIDVMWNCGNKSFTEERLAQYIRNRHRRMRDVPKKPSEGNKESCPSSPRMSITTDDHTSDATMSDSILVEAIPSNDDKEVNTLWRELAERVNINNKAPVQVLPVDDSTNEAKPVERADSQATIVASEDPLSFLGEEVSPQSWEEMFNQANSSQMETQTTQVNDSSHSWDGKTIYQGGTSGVVEPGNFKTFDEVLKWMDMNYQRLPLSNPLDDVPRTK